MSRCDGSSIRQYSGIAPIHKPCVIQAHAPAFSIDENSLRLEPWLLTRTAWAAEPLAQLQSVSAPRNCPWQYSTGARAPAFRLAETKLYILIRTGAVRGQIATQHKCRSPRSARILCSRLNQYVVLSVGRRFVLCSAQVTFGLETSRFTHPSTRDDLLASRCCLDGLRHRRRTAGRQQYFSAPCNPRVV